MPSVDEDNVVEKGELEATKVNYTFVKIIPTRRT